MTHRFFSQELEGIATFWRIQRPDGVTLGFTAHDRDLWFDGVLHRAAPGMLPSAIRRNAALEPDSAEVEGALSHDAISAKDLAEGRFDEARVLIGAVDWEGLERAVLYRGTIGAIRAEASGFMAELRSAKAELAIDPIPRTSPTCRAQFCGPGCTLSPARYTHEALLEQANLQTGRLQFAGAPPFADLADGHLRWLDGPLAGLRMDIASADETGLLLDQPLDPTLEPGARALLREGCDHTVASCAGRFANAANFQGEPFLPGNDLLARYPAGPR